MAKIEAEIRRWLACAVQKEATHLIVVWDGFSYEEYPVFVSPVQKVEEIAAQYGFDSRRGVEQIANENMLSISEIYSLALPLEQQIAEPRAMHWER